MPVYAVVGNIYSPNPEHLFAVRKRIVCNSSANYIHAGLGEFHE